MKKLMKNIGHFFAFFGITVLGVFITLVLTIFLICHGPSESAKELFAVTILETGKLKFLANIFLSNSEIEAIVAKNSLSEMDSEVDTELIITNVDETKELIEIHKVSCNGFEGTMMVINDPSKISLAPT